MNPNKFDALVQNTQPLWVKAEAKRLRHPRKIKKGGELPYALTLEESVAMVALNMRAAYVTNTFLSTLFHIHQQDLPLLCAASPVR